MIFVDLSNEFYKKLSNHILSQNEIDKYVFDIINYLEIEDYIVDLEFIDTKDSFGTYSFENLTIKLDIPKIISEAKINYKAFNINENEILFINLNLLQAILHEVMHAIQNCYMNEFDYAYSILYAKELIFKNKMSDELYDKYYYLFSYERDAIITSLENILHIIKTYYKKSERTFNYFLSNLYEFLILGYKEDKNNIKSPAEQLYENIYHENTPILSNIDIYDTMKLGYQINSKNFHNFKKNRIRKILSKNDLL